MADPASGNGIDRLLAVMARLRDPERGCPWDLEQTFRTIAPYTIEESYEVADAVERGDVGDLREELGDLLFQVVFQARIAEQLGLFTFDDVAQTIAAKMIRRHPHVFGETRIDDAAGTSALWETQKAAERAERAARVGQVSSVLDGIATGLPALLRALKLQQRAARVGFDWSRAEDIFAKLDEEAGELRDALAAGADKGRTEDELGDLLFVVVNLARHCGVDADSALRRTNAKFERRFRRVETLLAEAGRMPAEASLDDLEALWTEAKAEERA